MNAREIDLKNNMPGVLIVVVVVVALIAGLLSRSFVIVDSGTVGVVRTLGAVQVQHLDEGFHIVKPFLDKVTSVDIRLQSAESDSAAASKDLQIVTTEISVQYSIVGSIAPMTFQRVGTGEKISRSLVGPAIQESVKAVTAQYTAESLVTKRSEVKLQIQEAIIAFIDTTLLEKDLVGAIRIANVAITDFNFSAEFNKAIEMKVRAEQQALQAENEKEKIITVAEANAAQRELEAAASAFQIEAESVARAEAIKREADALRDSPELIQLRTIEQWDGVMPKFVGGGAMPFLDVGNMLKDEKPAE